MKKKIVFKCILFLCIFFVLFLGAQEILRYKWDSDLTVRMSEYEEEPEGTIDVVYFGSSPIYAGMNPMAMWNSYSITSFNFGISMQAALPEYYQVAYALTEHTPKVVVIDLCALTQERSADDEAWEVSYRKVIDTMPDWRLKISAIKDVVQDNEDQTWLSYLFPIVRYHDRWNELSREDFDEIARKSWYKDYLKGALMSKAVENLRLNEEERREIENLQEDDVTINEINASYYDRIISLCKEKGINVVAVSLPKYDRTWSVQQSSMSKLYCTSRGIPFIEYMNDNKIQEVGLDLSTDFYNSGHLNVYGAEKITKNLGGYLKEWYNLEDHREDINYDSWNESYQQYMLEFYGGE